jgi:hypothetical protein
VAAGVGTTEQQVGDIGTPDEEDQRDDHHDGDERLLIESFAGIRNLSDISKDSEPCCVALSRRARLLRGCPMVHLA